jgi:hypothetical protein
MPHERKARYLEPYSLTLEKLAAFVDSYYRLLNQPGIAWFGC